MDRIVRPFAQASLGMTLESDAQLKESVTTMARAVAIQAGPVHHVVTARAPTGAQ